MMPMIEIDEHAREILKEWKSFYYKKGMRPDYSETIRYMHEQIPGNKEVFDAGFSPQTGGETAQEE